MRTRRFIAHFPSSFRLNGVSELLPAGAYALDQEEQLTSTDGGGVGYRRGGMFMYLPTVSGSHWTMRLVPVEPSDVEPAILENVEGADGNPIA
jgi:hypothetical protein